MRIAINNSLIVFFIASILLFPFVLVAQQQQPTADSTQNDSSEMNMMSMMNMPGMSMEMMMTPWRNEEPMSLKGSGTSWLPESSPMYMAMEVNNGWTFMEHGELFARYDHQGGDRGGYKFDAPNWLMGMAERDIGDGHLRFSGMFSLDPITEGGEGYPLLFQTGETWHGAPLIDRQHPHDMFAELSAYYSQNIFQSETDKARVFLYAGYPGEPALGAPAFMHRPSAMYLPDAPISHHWQDATHITFGVATLGVTYNNLKIEGCAFNGSEPDENRYDFDTLRINSFSGRLSFNPTENIALQVSNGFLTNPEGDGVDVHRSSASMLYSTTFEGNHDWNSSLAWGQNYDNVSGAQNSVLLESAYTFSDFALSTRIEVVQKPRRDIGIYTDPNAKETLGEYILGLTRRITSVEGLDLSLGAQGGVNSMPSELAKYYGSNPFSFEVYLSIHPSKMVMDMEGM